MDLAVNQARAIRDRLPAQGLFANQEWRTSPTPFPLEAEVVQELESLGRVLLQFYRAVNLLYRKSTEGKQPRWIAEWLDRGKPAKLLGWQRHRAFKNELPRVIRPDVLLTENGLNIVELDSVPGGIGLTSWLNRVYSEDGGRKTEDSDQKSAVRSQRSENGDRLSAVRVLGGAEGMLQGFASIFGDAPRVHIIVSEEAATYRPEMAWLAEQLGNSRFTVQDADFDAVQEGDAVYRFFELFDLANIPAAERLFTLASEKRIRLTPPPKPVLEEKMWFALLWNRNLQGYWRAELGESFFDRLRNLVPYSWIIDPVPLPPQAAIPELDLTDWHQLKTLSHRERELILKISGFSELAWGARSVALGSDLSLADWSAAVDTAIRNAERSPYVLQRYYKPRLVEASYVDFEANALRPMPGRVRLCPYYFVTGESSGARAQLGGVLATICPADKKIIHGMKDAILAPCSG